MSRRLGRNGILSCFLLVALAGASAASAALGKGALEQELIKRYEEAKSKPAVLALDPGLSGRMNDKVALDAFLAAMPLSPLEYLKVDMKLNRYEIAIPQFLQRSHERWVALHEATARTLYGDEEVDTILSGWPVDTGADVVGSGVDAASVTTNRNVASTDVPAPDAYDGEIQIAVNHRNPNQMVASANTWGTAGAACNNDSTLSVFYSNDGGATWNFTCAPSNNVMALGTCTATVFGSDPALYWNDNNEVFLNYMLLCASQTTTKYAMVVARSADGGATWVKQGVIKNSWATTSLEDKNFYAIDNTATSPFYGRHYTCWDRGNNEKFAYSSNNGASWTEVDLPTALSGGLDLGCEIAVQKNGNVHVVFDTLTCGVSTCSNEQMYYTRSTNGGVSWSTPILVKDFNLVSFSSNSSPQVQADRGINPFGAVAVDNSGGACDGTLYAVYSDFASGSAADNDVWLTRSTNGGTTWNAAIKVNDDGLAGRTQFHPFVQVDQSTGHVVVAWHDARNDANNRKVEIYAARSTNCGVSVEANVKASLPSVEFNNSGIAYTDENTTDNPNGNPNQFGEYMGLDVVAGKAYVAWTDTRHFYPGSSTNAQKENVGFTTIDFGATGGAVCGNNLVESPEVCDGTNLAGQTCVSQGFTGGTLSCNATCSAFVTTACTTGSTQATFTSDAATDGYVRESTETSGTGNTSSATTATSTAIRAGDDASDRQYRGIVSFNTASLPDGAVIQSVELRLRRGTVSGTNPFGTHGSLLADMSPAFGGNTALASADFQNAASATAVCTLSAANANGDWSTCLLNAAGLAAVNKTGFTQFRVAFSLDDNDDTGADYVGFYSGDNATAANRPVLVVTYQ
ncbi:MAG: exo-alpha-sialidase [Holophagales bacterium]|nr:MAG: exo-alpha-sialidase [Holophagales bacterium]